MVVGVLCNGISLDRKRETDSSFSAVKSSCHASKGTVAVEANPKRVVLKQ